MKFSIFDGASRPACVGIPECAKVFRVAIILRHLGVRSSTDRESEYGSEGWG